MSLYSFIENYELFKNDSLFIVIDENKFNRIRNKVKSDPVMDFSMKMYGKKNTYLTHEAFMNKLISKAIKEKELALNKIIGRSFKGIFIESNGNLEETLEKVVKLKKKQYDLFKKYVDLKIYSRLMLTNFIKVKDVEKLDLVEYIDNCLKSFGLMTKCHMNLYRELFTIYDKLI